MSIVVHAAYRWNIQLDPRPIRYVVMSAINDLRSNTRRNVAIVIFCLLQSAAYIAALVAVSAARGRFSPWPTVITFGIVLAQCALVATFTVFGTWRFSLRVAASAVLVILGAGLVMLADDSPMRSGDFVLLGLFALVMWGTQQLPLWCCRLLLHARTVAHSVTTEKPSRTQYGIRQLMGLEPKDKTPFTGKNTRERQLAVRVLSVGS
jgi:hypothetical protein